LINVSGTPAFRPLYDSLSGMGFYNLNPDRIRDLQPPDPGDLLARDGWNVASVLASLETREPSLKRRIEEYLAAVVPGVTGVVSKPVGPKETVEFRQQVKGSKDAWRFSAANMSDGTLRVLGILVALFQGANAKGGGGRLIGIEEPEAALHPAAAGVLRDGLRDASSDIQVLVTSHSPELLDDKAIGDTEVLAVIAEHGETKVGPLDARGRTALRDHLYTAGELLRMDLLQPEAKAVSLNPDQLVLFTETPLKP